jgi:short-subunit dehydrogenase
MSARQHTFTHVLITGGSSGIGEGLALAYAAPGVTISLTGRDSARVAAVCAACRDRGADASGDVVDVTDAAAMAAWIAARDAVAPLDLVIANAGVSSGTANAAGDVETDSRARARRVFAVNVDGVLNTVFPAVAAMRTRKRGHVALMSSLAGFRGVGGAAAYGASKAAVRVWGEGLHKQLKPDNITVSVICPGFVKSRITDQNRFRMPFFMNTDKAAAIIMRGIAARRTRIAFPWPMRALVWMFAALPDSLAVAVTLRLPAKP